MNIGHIAVFALAAGLAAGSATAAGEAQPPMDSFNGAFYTCEDGGAFMVSYDSETPETATVTTNSDNKRYQLKRTPSSGGVEFTDGRVKFSTVGKTGLLQGTSTHFQNCRTKVG